MKQAYYVTKYALTRGITEDLLEVGSTTSEYAYGIGDLRHMQCLIGRDCFLDRAEAVKAAEALRLAKIKSLKVQIAKLEAMRFE